MRGLRVTLCGCVCVCVDLCVSMCVCVVCVCVCGPATTTGPAATNPLPISMLSEREALEMARHGEVLACSLDRMPQDHVTLAKIDLGKANGEVLTWRDSEKEQQWSLGN
jgi:hypothetical protein